MLYIHACGISLPSRFYCHSHSCMTHTCLPYFAASFLLAHPGNLNKCLEPEGDPCNAEKFNRFDCSIAWPHLAFYSFLHVCIWEWLAAVSITLIVTQGTGSSCQALILDLPGLRTSIWFPEHKGLYQPILWHNEFCWQKKYVSMREQSIRKSCFSGTGIISRSHR